MKNYPLEIVRLQLEEVAMKYGAMCESCATQADSGAQRKAYDGALEVALHCVARSFYAVLKPVQE